MNIDYDNNKLAEIIKNLIVSASEGQTSAMDISKGDTDILLKKTYDPEFLSNTSFYNYYDSFKNSLVEALNQNVMTQGKGIKFNEIITEYNKLIRFLSSQLNYNSLSSFEKDIVDKEMTNLIDDVDAVKELTKSSGPTEMFGFALENIINNLSDKSYGIVKVELKKTLDNQKKQLDELEVKLNKAINDFYSSPTETKKIKVGDLYETYSNLYKKIARVFTKPERRKFMINDDGFLTKIEQITGINEKPTLQQMRDATTTQGSVAGPTEEQKQEMLRKQQEEAIASTAEASTLPKEELTQDEKVGFLEQLLEYIDGKLNKTAVKKSKALRDFIFPILAPIDKENFGSLSSNSYKDIELLFSKLSPKYANKIALQKYKLAIEKKLKALSPIGAVELGVEETKDDLEGEGIRRRKRNIKNIKSKVQNPVLKYLLSK